jgi:hypothetical protein
MKYWAGLHPGEEQKAIEAGVGVVMKMTTNAMRS